MQSGLCAWVCAGAVSTDERFKKRGNCELQKVILVFWKVLVQSKIYCCLWMEDLWTCPPLHPHRERGVVGSVAEGKHRL